MWCQVNFWAVLSWLSFKTYFLWKAKEPTCSYYLLVVGEKTDGFISLLRALSWNEMQTILSRIWTLVANSVSLYDNYCTTCLIIVHFKYACLLFWHFDIYSSSCLIIFASIQNWICSVGWGCRIHWLHLCSGVRLPQMIVLDMTLNNLMVRFQYCWSFVECGVPLYCHCSLVISDLEW